MKQEETRYQKAIQKRIKDLGGDSWKVHGSAFQRVGEPDIDGWIPYAYGHIHLKLEVKTPEGEPSPIQLVRLRKYWKAGYLAAVVVHPEEVDALQRAWTKWAESGLLTLPRNWICILREEGIEDTYNIYEGNDTPCTPLS